MPQPSATTDQKYQTLEKRFWAGVIDALVLSPVTIVSAFIYQVTDSTPIIVIWLFVTGSVYWLYSVLGHGWYGQTVGKHLMKVRVVDNATEGPITMRQAVIRDCFLIAVDVFSLVLNVLWMSDKNIATAYWFQIAVSMIDYSTIVWMVLEIASAWFNSKRRAVHDFIAGTVVVRVDEPVTQST